MTLPEEIGELKPKTSREYFIVIDAKLDDLLSSRQRADKSLADFIEKTNDWIRCHEREAAKRTEKVDQLENKVKGWNIINSLGVIIAGILAALGLKGS